MIEKQSWHKEFTLAQQSDQYKDEDPEIFRFRVECFNTCIGTMFGFGTEPSVRVIDGRKKTRVLRKLADEGVLRPIPEDERYVVSNLALNIVKANLPSAFREGDTSGVLKLRAVTRSGTGENYTVYEPWMDWYDLTPSERRYVYENRDVFDFSCGRKFGMSQKGIKPIQLPTRPENNPYIFGDVIYVSWATLRKHVAETNEADQINYYLNVATKHAFTTCLGMSEEDAEHCIAYHPMMGGRIRPGFAGKPDTWTMEKLDEMDKAAVELLDEAKARMVAIATARTKINEMGGIAEFGAAYRKAIVEYVKDRMAKQKAEAEAEAEDAMMEPQT